MKYEEIEGKKNVFHFDIEKTDAANNVCTMERQF